MRVALLSYNARPGDAIGNQVAAKLRFFRERGAAVRVFLEDDTEIHADVKGNDTIWRDARPEGEHWTYLRGCDLIVVEYGQHYQLFELLPTLAGGPARVVVDYHGVTPPQLWGRHNRQALDEGTRRRGLVGCADHVIVHSRYTFDEVRRECKVPSDRISLLGYGIDLPAQLPAAPSESGLRRRLGLGDATVLLYVGRLAPNKRVPVLVEAVSHLRDVRPEVHLLIVGDDRDLYAYEAEACRRRARELGVAGRVHLLGRLFGQDLAEAYRAADAFVTASAWESFCIPVAEAMAHGVPVVAARATALPDTLADAGLNFTLDDPLDLARVVRDVLKSRSAATAPVNPHRRIGVVNLQAEPRAVSGVERSLHTMARALQYAGHTVEWLTAVADPVTSQEAVSASDATLARLPHSHSLLAKIDERAAGLDAIVIGPYLSRLTLEVARRYPGKTLLVPCFHDEPEAHWPQWHEVYRHVAGFLYHSEAEQTFAQSVLVYNHPNAVEVGTLLPPVVEHGGAAKPSIRGRYLLYSGRYTAEKNLPTLLEYAARYHLERPDRFQFCFTGAGSVPIPREPWAVDLGTVAEADRTRMLAGADALAQLSCRESLSLAALEAWQVGTPVIAHTGCPVLASHLAQNGGGTAIDSYRQFAAALDHLWENPDAWRQRGHRGQAWTRERYESEPAFRQRLEQALAGLATPLYRQLQDRGHRRAETFSQSAWQQRFAAAVDRTLDTEREADHCRLEVRRRLASRRLSPGRQRLLVPIALHNRGRRPVVADGPGRTILCSRVWSKRSGQWAGPQALTALPRLVLPGEKVLAAVAVAVPQEPGEYEVWFWAQPGEGGGAAEPAEPDRRSRYHSCMRLQVTERDAPATQECSLVLGTIQQDLDEADRLQHLPDDYLDITQGALAKLKRQIKQKLLHNFKVAYVDVVSRQQSAFNRQVLNVVRELAECCTLLDHAVQQLAGRPDRRRRRRKRVK